MKLIILSNRERLYEREVKEVILPGRNGEFSVWDFHQPFLHRLGRGYIKAIECKSESKQPSILFLLKDGLARMWGNTLTVLVES